MNTCKDCRFWIRYRDKKGACDLATATNEIPKNASFAIAIAFSVQHPDAVIHANLETSPEFGCNQFEAKPDRIEGRSEG